MEEPTPDGRIVVHFVDGHTLSVMFKDIRTWRKMAWGVEFLYPRKTSTIPWVNIRKLECIYNSEEVTNQLIGYRREVDHG